MDTRLIALTTSLTSQGVVGVSVPDWNDKSTWEVWFTGEGAAVKALNDARIASIIQSYDISIPAVDPLDTWDMISLKIAFNHENRIRVLEGKAAITLAQFKTAVRSLL